MIRPCHPSNELMVFVAVLLEDISHSLGKGQFYQAQDSRKWVVLDPLEKPGIVRASAWAIDAQTGYAYLLLPVGPRRGQKGTSNPGAGTVKSASVSSFRTSR